ncbi:hypothetical protein DSM107133_02682 [Pseudosulfitobacter sp. DSM 107133]|nr:hypothetical protein DSM107133_02682 [Pseudosulfitobacter sp. DSM 107133]
MNSRDNFIFTHYTSIAESCQRDVSRQQAETAANILRGLVATLLMAVRRSSRGNQAGGTDQA